MSANLLGNSTCRSLIKFMEGSFDDCLHNRGNEFNFPFQVDISKIQAAFQRLVHVVKGYLLVGLSPVISCSNHSNQMQCYVL